MINALFTNSRKLGISIYQLCISINHIQVFINRLWIIEMPSMHLVQKYAA